MGLVRPTRVAWWMLDGVGLAPAGPFQPLAREGGPSLAALGISLVREFIGPEFVVRPIDPRLGVPGLPQSGTGQTTLLTGINAAKHLGHHFGPWPGPSLLPLLENSIPARVARAGGEVSLVNFYPQAYFDAIESGHRRLGAIALAASRAGAELRRDGIPPPLGDPEHLEDTPLSLVTEWARSFISSSARLTIFDSWWSDHLGHRGTWLEALEHVRRLEVFARILLENRPEDTLLLVTSDHGNFEAMDQKAHTDHLVPFAAVGPGASEFAEIVDLTGVALGLARVFDLEQP